VAVLPDGIFFKPKMPILVNFCVSCNERCWIILWPFHLFFCHLVFATYGHLLYFVIILEYMSRFGMLYQEKSGNPVVWLNKQAMTRLRRHLSVWSVYDGLPPARLVLAANIGEVVMVKLELIFQVGNGPEQGCQMGCFQTQNPNLGKFWRVLQW
jgi:hypothetical protein